MRLAPPRAKDQVTALQIDFIFKVKLQLEGAVRGVVSYGPVR